MHVFEYSFLFISHLFPLICALLLILYTRLLLLLLLFFFVFAHYFFLFIAQVHAVLVNCAASAARQTLSKLVCLSSSVGGRQ